MRWLGRFDWTGGALVLPYPPQLWRETRTTIGGSARSGGGALAGYVVRTDHLLAVPLRLTAAEWPDLRALLAWAETGEDFIWTPDAEYPWLTFTCTLDSPKAGEAVTPEPDAAYPKVRVVTLTLRRSDGEPFDLDYFTEPQS